jgi:hypothetical protein
MMVMTVGRITIVSGKTKLLLKLMVSCLLIPLLVLIISETFLGAPKQLYFRSDREIPRPDGENMLQVEQLGIR